WSYGDWSSDVCSSDLCTNLVVFGYATPLDALAAGILAGFAARITVRANEDTDDLRRNGNLIAYCRRGNIREREWECNTFRSTNEIGRASWRERGRGVE